MLFSIYLFLSIAALLQGVTAHGKIYTFSADGIE
jgi:hypothetical protein